MNVLLVGLGRWGEKHLRVLRELGATVWVADVAPARLEWARRQGVEPARAVRDYREAIARVDAVDIVTPAEDRKSTRLNSSHDQISYAVFCLKKKKKKIETT